MKIHISITALSIAMLAGTAAVAATGNARNGLTALQDLNVIALKNFNASGGETEGKAYVGGNFTGNTTQVGFGNSQQGQAASNYATLTVGGTLGNGVNLYNGPNGSSGTLGNYGATVGGNAGGKIDLHNKAATVNVGGNLDSIGFVGGSNAAEGTTLNVVGKINQSLDLGDYSKTTVGCAGVGSGTCVGTIQGGNAGAVVKVKGNVATLQFGPGGTAQIGGNLGNAKLNNNQKVDVTGTIGGGSFGNGNTVKALGSIAGNGSNGTSIYAGGAFSGNANGASVNANYNFAAPGAVSVPTSPTAPVVASTASITAQLAADVRALSTTLTGMAATNFVTGAPGNAAQETFTVTNTDATTAAVFNLTAAQFNGAQQFQFNLANLLKPVIINVSGATSYTWNATFASGNGAFAVGDLKQLNQSLIWNFVDATSLEVGREVHGSVLAALATVHNGSNIEGSVVADTFNQAAEVHLGTYARSINFLPASNVGEVPEPAQWAMFLAGFGMIGATARRRRTTVVAA